MIKSSERSIILVVIGVLLVASTFIGVSLNGGEKGWIYVNAPLRDFLSGHQPKVPLLWHVIYIILIGWNIILFLLPVLIVTRFGKWSVIIIPPIYLLLTITYFPLVAPLCIPFFLLWIVALVVFHRWVNVKNANC